MQCPNCSTSTQATCSTCAGDGTVPDWLADPHINGESAARTWR
ncbi:hypothetical protein SK854_30165 [Lentzea sp. BCCO 10_0061]|uniref:Uncharacterized protein n=1 Tax=Lentzea sokolovensis TaxID=3095429 RepID=A0ABU4V3N7_9PSEU|nr:hypothetical protein [Lentzea sp. BCCO 10_0061]MDX8146413.1 hypothetical protein [Lentzea sp. BCCO 10_0061]